MGGHRAFLFRSQHFCLDARMSSRMGRVLLGISNSEPQNLGRRSTTLRLRLAEIRLSRQLNGNIDLSLQSRRAKTSILI